MDDPLFGPCDVPELFFDPYSVPDRPSGPCGATDLPLGPYDVTDRPSGPCGGDDPPLGPCGGGDHPSGPCGGDGPPLGPCGGGDHPFAGNVAAAEPFVPGPAEPEPLQKSCVSASHSVSSTPMSHPPPYLATLASSALLIVGQCTC